MFDENKLVNPCVRNCCLDEAEVCMGCFRSLEEILAWHGATRDERQEILRRCAQRKQLMQRPREH